MTITKETLSGLFTAIVTPFTKDNEVDYEKIRQLVRRQISAGATGIVPIGGTGEYPALSRSERKDIVAAAVKAAGDAPVIPGLLATGFKDALDAGEDFKSAGAAGVMLVTPYYSTGPQDGIRSYFAAFRQALDLPLMAYEIPRRTTVAVKADTYAKMANDGSIIGVKYSSYDVPEFIRMIRDAGSELAVLSGEEPLFATHVSLGASGGVLASATLYPEFWMEVFKLSRSGDLKEALQYQKKIDPILDTIYSETNPGPLKYLMKLCGIDVGGVRLPLTPPKDETVRRLHQALSDFKDGIAA